jgi:hypothetical protein
MAGALPAQAQVRPDRLKGLKQIGFLRLPRGLGAAQLMSLLQRQSLFADLGVAVIVASQRRRDEARSAVPDRPSIYTHNRQNNLAR